MFEPSHQPHSAALISPSLGFDVEVCHLLRSAAEGGTLILSPPDRLQETTSEMSSEVRGALASCSVERVINHITKTRRPQ